MLCIGKQISWLLMHYLKGDSICLSEVLAHGVFIDNKKSVSCNPVTFIPIQKIRKLNFTGHFIRKEWVNRRDFGSVWNKRKNRSTEVICREIRLILKGDWGKQVFLQAQIIFVAVGKHLIRSLVYASLEGNSRGGESLFCVKKVRERGWTWSGLSGVKWNHRNE